MKKIIILFIILIIVAVGGTMAQSYVNNKTIPFLKTPKATINSRSFNLELANTDEKRQVGLSSKNSLDENSGMLFLFDKEDYYPFWMKNMKFSIDIIYIKDNKIITIHRNVEAPKTDEEYLPMYRPEEPADKVLEIKAGVADKYNLKNGDEIKLENL